MFLFPSVVKESWKNKVILISDKNFKVFGCNNASHEDRKRIIELNQYSLFPATFHENFWAMIDLVISNN